MTDEKLAAVQKRTECEHVRKLGEPCDLHSGGWWDCSCAMVAQFKDRAPQQGSQETK